MTKDNVIELYNDELFEIACHGDMHQNDFADISSGINKLSKWLNEGCKFDSIGFSSPGSDFVVSKEIEEQLKDINVRYVRIFNRYKNWGIFKVLCRKASRVVKLPLFYKLAYKDTCFDSIDGLYIYSIPVLHQVTFKQIMSIVNYAVLKSATVC